MITSLRMGNFKTFSDTTLPLGKLTLLSGLNSSGKSTIMQALALMRQGYESHQGGTAGETRDAGLPLNGDYVELGTGQDVLYDNFRSERAEILLEARLEGEVQGGVVALYEQEDDVLMVANADAYTGSFWESSANPLVGLGFQYLRADRITAAVTYSRSYEMTVRKQSLGTRGEFVIDYLRQHQDDVVPEQLRHPRADSSRLLAQVDAWMGEICPGVRLIADAIANTDLVRLGVQMAVPGQPISTSRRPTNVGFGISYVLPIIVACLTARDGALLLLENPEAHVHPRGQSAMARLAAATASRAQVVVETHSDHVLNGVRLAVKHGNILPEEVTLHYVHRAAGEVAIASPQVGRDGMLSAWPEGFFDEWDDAVEELLT